MINRAWRLPRRVRRRAARRRLSRTARCRARTSRPTSKLGPNGSTPSANAPVRWAQADDAAIACRDPDRAAAVGTEREIDEAARDRRRRAVRRAARYPAGRIHVHGRSEMHVLAGQAVAKLVAMGLGHHVGAGREKPLHRRRSLARRRMRAQPIRLPEAGAGPRDMKRVLHREGEAAEPAGTATLQERMVLSAKRPKRVIRRRPTGHL